MCIIDFYPTEISGKPQLYDCCKYYYIKIKYKIIILIKT